MLFLVYGGSVGWRATGLGLAREPSYARGGRQGAVCGWCSRPHLPEGPPLPPAQPQGSHAASKVHACVHFHHVDCAMQLGVYVVSSIKRITIIITIMIIFIIIIIIIIGLLLSALHYVLSCV